MEGHNQLRKMSLSTGGSNPQNRRRNEGEDQRCSRCKETLSVFTKYVLVRCLILALYLLDILTDVNAAYEDYKAGDEIFAFITLGLVFAPGILFSCYLFCEYLLKYIGEIACLKAPLWIVISPFMPVWVIVRDLKQIIFGIIATLFPSQRDKYKKKISRSSKVYLIKFLEAFTEAAPQLLVRLFRVASRSSKQFSDLRRSEIIQISFSLVTLSMKVVSTHQQSVSTQQIIDGEVEIDSKYSLSWYLQILALIWWLCFLTSRFEALVLFSASYGYWVLLVVGIHVLLIFLFQTIADYKDRLKRIFIYLFGAFVFIFAYVQFNLKTRLKIALWFPYTVFTVVLFVENSIMLTFWFFDQRRSIESILNPNTGSFVMSLGDSSLPLNATVEDISSVIGMEELQNHWKFLLLLHYGIFGVGLLFMIAVFWGVSVCTSDDISEERSGRKRSRVNVELQNLTAG